MPTPKLTATHDQFVFSIDYDKQANLCKFTNVTEDSPTCFYDYQAIEFQLTGDITSGLYYLLIIPTSDVSSVINPFSGRAGPCTLEFTRLRKTDLKDYLLCSTTIRDWYLDNMEWGSLNMYIMYFPYDGQPVISSCETLRQGLPIEHIPSFVIKPA